MGEHRVRNLGRSPPPGANARQIPFLRGGGARLAVPLPLRVGARFAVSSMSGEVRARDGPTERARSVVAPW